MSSLGSNGPAAAIRRLAQSLVDVRRRQETAPMFKQATIVGTPSSGVATIRFKGLDIAGAPVNVDVPGIRWIGATPAAADTVWVADLGRGRLLILGVQSHP